MMSKGATHMARARAAAWAAVLIQPLFVAAWIVSGALQPNYSAVVQPVSDLAAQTARHPYLLVAALIALGISLAALTPGLKALLPGRPATTIALAAFAVAGLAFALAGVLRLDCSGFADAACLDAHRRGALSWHSSAHLWAGLVAELALMVGPFALTRALWPRPVAVLTLIAGAVSIGLVVAVEVVYHAGGGVRVGAGATGLLERIGLTTTNIWALLVAGSVLFATRRPPELPAPMAMRPRDFYRHGWLGEGEIVSWPWALGRLLPQRFTFTREVAFASDQLFVVRDEGRFAGGYVQRFVYFCEFRDPTHVHATASELPDGADLTIDDDGYRLAPFRLAVPVGPLRFTFHCREQPLRQTDGTIVDTITATWLGLPIARLTARTLPDEPAVPYAATAAIAG